MPFVRPEPTTPEDPIVARVPKQLGHHAGLAELLRVAIDVDPSRAPNERELYLLERVISTLVPYADEPVEHVLLRAIYALVNLIGQVGWPNGDVVVRAVGHLPKADFNDAFRAILAGKDGASNLRYTGIAKAMMVAELIHPNRFVDIEAIRTTKKLLGVSWDRSKRERDPSCPEFWSTLDPERAMASFATLMEQEPIATLGALAWGLERCLELRYSEASHLRALLTPHAAILCRRRRAEAMTDRLLTRTNWSFLELLGEKAPEAVADDYHELRELAISELGRMRVLLRSNDASLLSEEERGYLHAAAFFVLRTDSSSLWEVLRRLLLAFHDLPQLSIPMDLRAWDEGERDRLPQPWGWLPNQISTILELLLDREDERDPGLVELRRNLAQFCLDRIKTHKRVQQDVAITPEMLVERNAIWRVGYIEAACALHGAVGDRGHHVLRWSKLNDPDPRVRDAAKRAYGILRRGTGMPANTSPRRAVVEAFWWLRQSHVLAHGGQPDEQGARRTLQKEVRRQPETKKQ